MEILLNFKNWCYTSFIISQLEKFMLQFILGITAINGSNVANDPNLIRPTGNHEVDTRNLVASLENNPNVPRNCTITRPPPITKPGR